MNVLSQYGAGGGAGLTGTFVQAHNLAVTSTGFTVADVQNWIQILIDFGDMPDASRASSAGKVCTVVFLDDTIQINDPGFNGGADGGIVMCEPGSDSAFGFHWAFTTTSGNQMYFAVVGACDDTCFWARVVPIRASARSKLRSRSSIASPRSPATRSPK